MRPPSATGRRRSDSAMIGRKLAQSKSRQRQRPAPEWSLGGGLRACRALIGPLASGRALSGRPGGGGPLCSHNWASARDVRTVPAQALESIFSLHSSSSSSRGSCRLYIHLSAGSGASRRVGVRREQTAEPRPTRKTRASGALRAGGDAGEVRSGWTGPKSCAALSSGSGAAGQLVYAIRAAGAVARRCLPLSFVPRSRPCAASPSQALVAGISSARPSSEGLPRSIAWLPPSPAVSLRLAPTSLPGRGLQSNICARVWPLPGPPRNAPGWDARTQTTAPGRGRGIGT
ncbi:hypothetical protein H8959_008014 [Pygathrix nigripes]